MRIEQKSFKKSVAKTKMLPAQKNETIWGKFGVGYVGGWVTSEWAPFIF